MTCAAIAAVAVTALSAAAPQTTWDGVFSKAQVVAGDMVYQQHCSTCHGAELEGGEDAPPLAGAQFSTIWEGRMLGELLNRTERRMPKDAPGSLGREAYVDILAFLLDKNGFPAGSSKLPIDGDALNAIRYLTTAPAR